jgi:GDP-D-mannose 3',5'-epimerase
MGPTTEAARRRPQHSAGRSRLPSPVAQSRSGETASRRSFCYVDDCVEGLYRLMQSDYARPLNLGTDRMVTIDELAMMVIDISGKYDLSLVHVEGPQGVRGRNSDNTRLRDVLGWEPRIELEDGLIPTYRWIENQVRHVSPVLSF